MIPRYTRPEMAQVWSPQTRFEKMKLVEQVTAQEQSLMGLIPQGVDEAIDKARLDIQSIEEIEKTTKHEVVAFVNHLAQLIGDKYGRFVHYGLTSSDILDTALSLQIQEAGQIILNTAGKLEKTLVQKVKEHQHSLCVGRTHGVHAELTSFGFKLLGHLCELRRQIENFKTALKQTQICKLSGAVGVYSLKQGEELERKVAQKLNLQPEQAATQVVPRDRYAPVFFSLALLGTGLERLAVELRHLQRTEVEEVFEGFSEGQKGSSAMPHKKNPVSAENITGLARLLRSYLQASLDNVVLWHERDISHSSVERVIFPDAFIVCDYALHRMTDLMKNLKVNSQRMKHNISLSQGRVFSSQILLALVQKGIARDKAHFMVQRVSDHLKKGEEFLEKVLVDKEISQYLSKKDVCAERYIQEVKESISHIIEKNFKCIS